LNAKQESSDADSSQSEHLKGLAKLAQKAVDEYPAWREEIKKNPIEAKQKIQMTGNVKEWLVTLQIGDRKITSSEAEVIKGVLKEQLSDHFIEFKK